MTLNYRTIVQVRGISALASDRDPWHHCDMEHKMSDAELRRAIAILRDRASRAHRRGDDAEAELLEGTVRNYQHEMTLRP